jgi:hypothetical protein
VRGGTCCRGACELPQSARGSERGCAAAAMVVGSAHAPLSGIGRSEREREGEVRNVRVMPMPLSRI